MESSRRDMLKTAAASVTVLPISASIPATPATIELQPPDKSVTSPALQATGRVAAKVDLRLLTKAQRFFAGSVTDRICEMLQNARRAGATVLDVQVEPIEGTQAKEAEAKITLTDNGHGLTDFGQLLAFGFSGWADTTEAAEDPAGAGFFSLAPRTVLAQCRGKEVRIEATGWLGAPVDVTASDYTGHGLRLVFVDTPWTEAQLQNCAKYGSVQVILNGVALQKEPFLTPGPRVQHLPNLGVAVQHVRQHADVKGQLQGVSYVGWGYDPRAVVNFYGNRVSVAPARGAATALQGVWLIELTGEPTPLRLKLPSRDSVFQDKGLELLRDSLERIAYGMLLQQAEHRLSYSDWQRGHELGFNLPESVPVWRTTLGDWETAPEGDEASAELPYLHVPPDNDLNVSYITLDIMTQYASRIGFPYQLAQPESGYEGYSWVDAAPQLLSCEISAMETEALQDLLDTEIGFWSGRSLRIVQEIRAELRVGTAEKEHTLTVSLPIAFVDIHDDVLATVDAVCGSEFEDTLWELLGGYNGDSEDSYDTVRERFDKALRNVRGRLAGPHEPTRRKLSWHAKKLVSALELAKDEASVTVYADGRVVVQSPTSTAYEVLPAEVS